MVQGCAGSHADLGAKGHSWTRAGTELGSGLTPEVGVASCTPSTKPSELLRPWGFSLAQGLSMCYKNLLDLAGPRARVKGSG